jgi:hypothetical protein
MKLGWLYTDKYNSVRFYEERSEGVYREAVKGHWGTWVRIAYFPIEEGSSHTDPVPE